MFARTAFAALGMVAGFALGVAVGPRLDTTPAAPTTPPAMVGTAETPAVAPAPVTIKTPRATRAARVERLPAPTSSDVQREVSALLNRGAKPELAVAGFDDSRELMTVAHASRNTDIPFVLLKHRVLEQKMTLADAINESRPDLDARAEVTRARAAARADLDRLSN